MTEKRKIPLDPQLLARARQMRHESAPAEELLWSFLRNRQLGGHKFRRQTPLAGFVADFYCHEIDLVVELDGETHLDREKQDAVRTQILECDGHHLIRFWNTDVFVNLPGVLEAIFEECDRLGDLTRPHPNPLPEGEGAIHRAVEILHRGGMVAFPTETVYGLGADATNAAAVQRVFAAKGRPATNPCIVHVANAEVARQFAAAWPLNATKLADQFWPGPLTLVLPKTNAIVPAVTAGLNTVGLRAPDHPLTLDLLRQFAGPVIGPSANRSTHVSPTTAQHVRDDLGDAVDMILDGGACRVGIESTVLDLSGEMPTILRPGAVSAHMIEQVIGPVQIRTVVVEATTPVMSPGQHTVHYAPTTPTYRFIGKPPVPLEDSDVGFLLLTTPGPTEQRVIRMPDNPEHYARLMYHRLRELDGMGLRAIYVQMPPDQPPWLAVRDRLMRASRPTV